jgi:hypothetical protein
MGSCQRPPRGLGVGTRPEDPIALSPAKEAWGTPCALRHSGPIVTTAAPLHGSRAHRVASGYCVNEHLATGRAEPRTIK